MPLSCHVSYSLKPCSAHYLQHHKGKLLPSSATRNLLPTSLSQDFRYSHQHFFLGGGWVKVGWFVICKGTPRQEFPNLLGHLQYSSFICPYSLTAFSTAVLPCQEHLIVKWLICYIHLWWFLSFILHFSLKLSGTYSHPHPAVHRTWWSCN